MKLRFLIVTLIIVSPLAQVHTANAQYYHYVPKHDFISRYQALKAIDNWFVSLEQKRLVKRQSIAETKYTRRWLAQYDNPDYQKGKNAQFFIYGNTENKTLLALVQNGLKEIQGITLFDPIPHVGNSSSLAENEPKGTIIGEYLNPEGESFQIYYVGGVYANKQNSTPQKTNKENDL